MASQLLMVTLAQHSDSRDPRPTYQIVASDAVIEAIVTDALDGNYDVSASYELLSQMA